LKGKLASNVTIVATPYNSAQSLACTKKKNENINMTIHMLKEFELMMIPPPPPFFFLWQKSVQELNHFSSST
jgi:hypothetical protein